MNMDNQEVKRAVQEKEKKVAAGNKKKDKSADKAKKEKKNCLEPEVLVDSQKGTVIKVCSGQNVAEWKSLILLGKLALNYKANKLQPQYNRLYQTEAELGLKLYSELNKGE